MKSDISKIYRQRWKFSLTLLLFLTLTMFPKLAVSKSDDLKISLTQEHSIQQNQDKITVTGNVTDMDGVPLIGVSVVEEQNPSNGTITDVDGTYTIQVSKASNIQFSYIGFIKRVEEVRTRRVINVILQEDLGQLDEVVVVGYGTQKKESVVGAITTIEPSSLKTGTTRALSNNLAGSVGGVIGVQRSGEPGYDGSDFWIRGISSFKGSGKPLVLVDGIERTLDDLSVEEIASFSVLKDASATAVYGVRGANGVILIKTKRGAVGRTQIRINVEHAMTEPTKFPDYLGAADYMELLNTISAEGGGSTLFDPTRIENTRLGTDSDLFPDVNWLNAISRDFGNNTRVSADVSGGTERLRYSLVMGLYSEDGILARDKQFDWNSSLRVNKYNVRSNVDINLTNTTILGVGIGGYLQFRTSPPSSIDDLFNDAFSTPPMVHPTRYSSGQIPKVPERTNPWATTTQRGFQKDTSSKLETNLSLEQDLNGLLPGLKAKVLFAFDNYQKKTMKKSKDPDYYNVATGRDPETGELDIIISSYGQAYLGLENKAEYGDSRLYLEGNISYNHTFADIHNLDAMLLYNQQEYDNGDRGIPRRTQGFAGRFSYTLDSKYIAEFNFGYNGSENFAKGHKFGFFPSVAAGWIVSEEKFMQNLNHIFNKIKFRGSWGLVGNDNLDGRRFAFLSTIGDDGENGGYKWGYDGSTGRWGRWEGHWGVEDLTWETVAKTNIGVEIGLFNMFEIQADYFKEKRQDIFMQRVNIPSSAGFYETPWANFGKVDNKGFEVNLSFNKKFSNDLFVSAMGTFTYAKNEIIETDEEKGVIGTNRQRTGLPVNQLFGLIAERLYTDEDFDANGNLLPGLPTSGFTSNPLKPGDIKYTDVNDDGVIDSQDRSPIGGTENPQIVYGFGLNVTYKNFDLGVLFQGNGKTYKILGGGDGKFLPGSTQGATGNIYANAFDRWTEENPSQDAIWPRLRIGSNEHNQQESTWWLRNMSMLRLKNLELGYTFPTDMMRKMYVSNLRLFLRGTNLLCVSDFDMWDPEVSSNTGMRYPLTKSYSVGLQVNF